MAYLEVALVVSTALSVFSEEFIQVHTSCRYWDKLKIYSDGDTEELHCILDQDKLPGIVYTKWTTVPSGYCPIYNRHAKLIDCIPCNGSIGDCPATLVKSYQAVSYTACFQMPIVKTSVKREKSTPTEQTHTKDMDIYVGIIVLLVLTIALLGALIGTWIWIRRYRYQLYKEFKTITETIIGSERRTNEEIKRWNNPANWNSANPGSNGEEVLLLSSCNKEEIKM